MNYIFMNFFFSLELSHSVKHTHAHTYTDINIHLYIFISRCIIIFLRSLIVICEIAFSAAARIK